MKTSPQSYAPLFRPYDLHVRILTPVHVGIGVEQAWRLGVDYLLHDGQIQVLDPLRLHRYLAEEPGPGRQSLLEAYIDQISRPEPDHDRIHRLVQEGGLPWETITRHAFAYPPQAPPLHIQRHIRTGNGELYLPGSSVKGAIRSAIFAHLYEVLFVQRYTPQTEESLLGNFERSLLRYIRPYDVPFAASELVDVFVLNLYRQGAGWVSDYKKDMLPLSLECLSVGTESRRPMRLDLAAGFVDLVRRFQPDLLPTHLDKVLKPGAEEALAFLFGLINRHTQRHLERELAFFQAYDQAQDLDLILAELESLLRQVKALGDQKCLLRLAWGSGFHAMTGDWRFRDHLETIDTPDQANRIYSSRTRQKEPTRYKSRRLAEKGRGAYYAPMGFVELSRV